MKKILIISALLLFGNFALQARRDPIVIHQGGAIDDRGNQLCFDMPAVFYDHDEKTQEIIIDGGGVVSYYDVEISSPVTNTVEISTQVDGTYDTFDISSLSPCSHVITVESPSGNIYEGTFVTLEDGFEVEKGATFAVYPASF